MEKFPADICTAETKTNGNPNILNDPMFAPPKKINMKEIFGSPSTKKSTPTKKKRKGSLFLLHEQFYLLYF